MNRYTITDIVAKKNRIICKYEVSGDWAEWFSSQREAYIEYSPEIIVQDVPKSILAVPFIANILPAAWLADAKIIVSEIDKDFFDHIGDIKNGYNGMYPSFQFKGEIISRPILNNPQSDKTIFGGAFFSGGVDAYTTLLRNLETIEDLFILWGADIKLDDYEGWGNVWHHVCKVADEYNKRPIMIKTDFRHVLIERKMDAIVSESKDGWWHGFQHGISIISHAAPLANLFGYTKIYIASSYPKKMKGTYTCASDPSIDENVHFCGCKTIHDGYDLDRQDKVFYCLQKQNKNGKKIEFRVCWERRGGTNCCHCEKCYRTILELVSEGADPNLYGFSWNSETIRRCERDFKSRISIPKFNISQFYPVIQKRMIKNKDIIKDYKAYKWLVKMNFEHFNDFPIKRFHRSKLYKKLRTISELVKSFL